MKFMGGCYVFPGGSVEADDWSAETLGRCRGLSPIEARKILGDQLGAELSLAHWVAGIRELFEETGILLCVTANGGPLATRREDLRKRFAEGREAVAKGALDFRRFLESEGLYCDASLPVYFSHRVTPEKYATRFDTRFFLARLPEDQSPLFSSQEVTESLWITPQEALERTRNDSGLPIMPPTIAALRTLAAFDSWQSLCAYYPLR